MTSEAGPEERTDPYSHRPSLWTLNPMGESVDEGCGPLFPSTTNDSPDTILNFTFYR
ncbi:hypothetical protein AVEN_228563-1, partial [Araneus ventricosus]